MRVDMMVVPSEYHICTNEEPNKYGNKDKRSGPREEVCTFKAGHYEALPVSIHMETFVSYGLAFYFGGTVLINTLCWRHTFTVFQTAFVQKYPLPKHMKQNSAMKSQFVI
ncbi:hypothetical protein HID58_018073 [Brassica napus]|uniref:Uncharacterized protein n=1 Tax=Brassica napus TaxID=3708 RepID=A0ABQ8D8Y3_BRANA|nr:hypothetical protein HID58_018073 [Brassica napus]